MSALLKGEALIDGFALNFSLYQDGQRWQVSVGAQGIDTAEGQTAEQSPWGLLTKMLDEAIAETCRKFPARRRVARR